MMKQITAVFIMYVMVILLLIPGVQAAGPRPVPDFSSDIKEGPAPLPVSFTDLSSNDPAGWAWYFGDETYAVPWTLVNANPGWSARYAPGTVVMPDGDIVLMGGSEGNKEKNDVWRSSDGGATWVLVNASPGWLPRAGSACVVMPDGSIILLGGGGPSLDSFYNDVWRSTDKGATWSLVTPDAGWTARIGPAIVVTHDGSIVLMGGCDGYFHYRNDVWKSQDGGATWTLINANPGWTIRSSPGTVVMPDGRIILIGGCIAHYYFTNDVWQSTDDGATWTQVSAGAEWTPRAGQSTVLMPDNSIVLAGGWNDYVGLSNDVWRSIDGGATWKQLTANAGWSGRSLQGGVGMPDGSIVIMGGGIGGVVYNDVWRLQPAGSSDQNPSHTYTRSGTYQVALQAYNEVGFDSIRKVSYITVFPGPEGNISVSSNPVGAKIFLDGADTGHETPFTLPDVAEGNHQVSVTKDCYITPDPQNVIVIAGETVTTDFTLQSTGSCIPEFPSMVVPAAVLVGCIGVVILFGSRRQVTVQE